MSEVRREVRIHDGLRELHVFHKWLVEDMAFLLIQMTRVTSPIWESTLLFLLHKLTHRLPLLRVHSFPHSKGFASSQNVLQEKMDRTKELMSRDGAMEAVELLVCRRKLFKQFKTK